MDYGAILTNSKWSLIKELAKQIQTPTDLAEKTNTSIANVTQQLKLLEAYGLVKKEKTINNNLPGKPKTNYSIGKEIIFLTYISEGTAEKIELKLDPLQKSILNLWLYLKKEDAYTIEKYFAINEEILIKCQAVGIVGQGNNQIDLLIITEEIHDIRAKYSNKEIEDLEGRKKKIICWTHTIEEIKNGLINKEEYFKNLVSNLKPILDKENIFKKIEAWKHEYK
jgi:DNA-binding transcriptional ArsR family regulator